MIKNVKFQKRFDSVVTYVVLIIFSLFTLFPILWLVTTSLKPEVDAFSMPPKWIFRPILDNYKEVLYFEEFNEYFVNSFIVGIITVTASLFIGIPLAFCLTRFKFRWRERVMALNLITQVAPPVAFVIPYYVIMRTFGVLDTRPALSCVYLTVALPFTIWMMRAYIEEIPRELEEAAMVDGTTFFGAFRRVTLPLAAPGIAATAIFTFILCWNEFLYALMLTSKYAKTAPVAIASYNTYEGVFWGRMTAAGTLIMLPVLLFGFAVQKYLIAGLTAGAVKG